MDKALFWAKKLIPKSIFEFFQPAYHYLLALSAALLYRFPSRKIKVIAVTGTKGKSSVVEILAAIFEEAGFATALASTIHFKIRDNSRPNLFKMTTPGRFFVQKFLRGAVNAGCEVAVIELTSEAARQYRHKFIDLDALIFTNLQKEHIESHGSFEKYRDAKLEIARALGRSSKSPKFMIANTDDIESARFFEAAAGAGAIRFSLKDAEPYKITDNGIEFAFAGQKIRSSLPGQFNLYNLLAAASCAKAFGVSADKIKSAIEKLKEIPGRAQIIKGPGFDVVVDYAHTPDSLRAIYEAFKTHPSTGSGSISGRKLICVLGNTGGGRDTWKRPEMAKIADQYCDQIILTNEDPYDENPKKIVDEMAAAITPEKLTIEMDRRLAIRKSLILAKGMSSRIDHESSQSKIVVLVTGKGTDPYIMGPNGTKTPWSDKKVVEEEVEKISNCSN